MKKVLVLIGAAVLVMALATPSMAQFKSWGHIEFQTIYAVNRDNNFNVPTDTDLASRHIAERFRFYLQYGDPKTVRAVLGFEGDGTDWGTSTARSGGRNDMAIAGTDQVALEIKQAYLEFVIPQTPLSATIGMQWFTYGDIFFQGRDLPGVKLTAAFAPHQVELFWWREEDESRTTYNVNDVYGLEYDFKQKLFDFNAYFAYQNDLTPTTYDDHPWYAGIAAGFRPGNFDFDGRFSYVGGKQENKVAGGSDVDYKSWAAKLAARYKIGPGMFVGVEGVYSTGNDADDTGSIKMFKLANSSEMNSSFGNWRSVFYYRGSGVLGYYHEKQLNWMGTWYGNVNFEYSPTAWARMVLNYLYIGDTSKGTDGLAGINSPTGSRTDQDKDFVGHEINLITSLSIYKGFVYNIGLGYFIPGDVYDSPSKSADNGYAVHSKLIYSF